MPIANAELVSLRSLSGILVPCLLFTSLVAVTGCAAKKPASNAAAKVADKSDLVPKSSFGNVLGTWKVVAKKCGGSDSTDSQSSPVGHEAHLAQLAVADQIEISEGSKTGHYSNLLSYSKTLADDDQHTCILKESYSFRLKKAEWKVVGEGSIVNRHGFIAPLVRQSVCKRKLDGKLDDTTATETIGTLTLKPAPVILVLKSLSKMSLSAAASPLCEGKDVQIDFEKVLKPGK